MRRPGLLGIVVVLLAAGVVAQQQTPPTFRTGVDRVRVDVTVVDRNRPVRGLKAEDFQVKDNGREVPGVELATTMEVVSVAVALDLGPTVARDGWAEMVNTCEALIDALAPRDTAWLVTFADEVGLKAGPVRNKQALRRALADVKHERGSSMWDALFGSIALVTGQPGRAMVLLLSDGQDRTSFLDEERALEVMRRSEVAVVAIRPPHQPDGYMGLENAVRLTGGEIMDGKKGEPGYRRLNDVLDEFRYGYLLTYQPPQMPEPKDGWHEIDVSLKDKRGEVHARKGYYSKGK
jgi:VWFA-related protein